MVTRVTRAAELVNAVVPGESRGRAFPPAGDDRELRERVNGMITAAYRITLDVADAAALAAAAGQLREVFGAVDAGDIDSAAIRINAMVTEYGARPTLIRRGDEPWHLHFHDPDAPVVMGIMASFAGGFAYLLGTEYAERVGVCSAEHCDRVYMDVSRNGTKRFCSTACQNRTKTAAFRARRAEG